MTEANEHVAYVWPNGDWCWEDEYEEYSSNKSDDCASVAVPNEVMDQNDDAIEDWVYEYSKGV